MNSAAFLWNIAGRRLRPGVPSVQHELVERCPAVGSRGAEARTQGMGSELLRPFLAARDGRGALADNKPDTSASQPLSDQPTLVKSVFADAAEHGAFPDDGEPGSQGFNRAMMVTLADGDRCPLPFLVGFRSEQRDLDPLFAKLDETLAAGLALSEIEPNEL